jgi:hypothetical protein
MPTTSRPREWITLGDDGQPVRVPYKGDDLFDLWVLLRLCAGVMALVVVFWAFA